MVCAQRCACQTAGKAVLANLSPEMVKADKLVGIRSLPVDPSAYNQAPIGGLKVVTDNGCLPLGRQVRKTFTKFMLKASSRGTLEHDPGGAQAIVDNALK